jgi:hypothetical protein
MGREIRRVPMGWEHPKKQYPGRKDFHPLFDETFEEAMQEWLDELQAWLKVGFQQTLHENPDYGYDSREPYRSFCDYHGNPPNPEYYRPIWPQDAIMGFAIYETVSEGTPVTPTFAIKEELIDYLVQHGDFWDQNRGDGGWSRENAISFVEREWAPSLIITTTQTETIIHSPRDGA